MPMPDFTPKQKRLVLIVALLVYAAFMAGLFGWILFNGEETVERRLSQTPGVTISLVEKEKADVPSSWTEDKPAPEAMPPEVKEPLGPEQPDTAPPAAEEPQPEAPAVETPAEDQKPAEATPAETTPPFTEQQATEQPAAEPAPAVTSTAEQPAVQPEPPAVETNPVSEAAPPQAQTAPVAKETWQKFSRPFDQQDGRPRIGLVIADLGLASGATQSAIQDLPGEVTLGFSSLAPDLEGWISKARLAGHEVLLSVPMEPENYPKNDPGPNTLLTALSDKENVSRMQWALSRAEGYVGIMPAMGEKFVTYDNKMAPVMDVVAHQGLMVLDSTLNRNSVIPQLSRYARIPYARNTVIVDAAASRTAIESQLEQLENTAREKGQAVGVALPYPVTFEKLKPWIAGLAAKGITLAPITALTMDNSAAAVALATAPVAVQTPETAPVTTPAAPVAP